MFLKKFIYVNWGNIPNIEFELGPINLLSGGNGSGKTTAADAIQTIMTASHENLFQYNPGQDETTQKGRGGKKVRTLASYILGCDDGSYARLDATDGYLAAVFHPTEGESGDAFTALIGVRAWLEQTANRNAARQDNIVFFILPGEQLSIGDLIQEKNAAKHIVSLDKIQAQMLKTFGQTGVEKYDTKKAYLRRLYGILRGMNGAVTEREAMNAAKSFSRFMAYKPVKSINNFVAQEILEKKDLGDAIKSISGQLKTINAMERDASQLVESIEILKHASDYSRQYIDQWIELNVLDYTLAQSSYLKQQKAYLKSKKAQKDLQQSITHNIDETRLNGQRRQQIHDQLVSLEAQRMGVSALQEKDQLEQERDEMQQSAVEQAKQLLLQDNQLNTNFENSNVIAQCLKSADIAQDLPLLDDLNTRALCNELLEEGRRGDIDFSTLLGQDILGDLAPLEDYLDKARQAQQIHNRWVSHWHNSEPAVDEESLQNQLSRVAHQHENQYELLGTQCKQKNREVERLQAHKTNYPAYVERALKVIAGQCPEAQPQVLCDFVEVKDANWQSAIEGYLGGARFSIIVNPEYEAEAVRIVRNMPGRDNRARIIQGEKAQKDANKLSLNPDSIIHVLDFSHATAKYYLTSSYGNVLRVDSAKTLAHTRRGLTIDGMGSGNYSMWRCDLPDSELVFGAAARERALKAKIIELDNMTEQWQQANNRLQLTARLLKSVNALSELCYADAITDILKSYRDLQKLEQILAQLDLSEHHELEARLAEVKSQEQQWAEKERILLETKGQLEEKFKQIKQVCEKLNQQQEENLQTVEQCEDNLHAIAKYWTDFNSEAQLEQADTQAKDINQQVNENYHVELEKNLRSTERKLDVEIQKHNQNCRPSDVIYYRCFDGEYDATLFKGICALEQDIGRVYNQLQNNVLVEKHEQLTQLKQSFDSAFVTHLCHSIYQAISDGKRQIELLNTELQHHKFGTDEEVFRFAQNEISQFRDYERFFKEVMQIPQLGDELSLFEAKLSDKSIQVREHLIKMLLDEDEQKALKELERIADYRNYYQYEIYKEVEGKESIALSEYGTGSGGQLETPAYIIRSAAITSAFRFSEGSNHLRMVLVDEAFSKMDELRSREVINYLTQTLGLQLIFIMPTSKCGPFLDLISNDFIFAKCPSEQPRGQLNTRVLVDRKQCNQEKIKALWANHRRTIHQQAELDFMDEVLA